MLLGGGRGPATLLVPAAIVASVLPLVYLIRPHPISIDGRAMQSAAAWLRESDYADAPVISTNIWASYFVDRGRNIVPPASPDMLDGVDAGTVFIWDANHGTHARFGLDADSMQRRREWRLLWESKQQIGEQAAGRVYLCRP